jgi:hypothetical protein
MMKELVRVSMNAKQIREACEQFARDRIASNGEMAVSVIGIEDAVQADVVFTRKRVKRKAAAVDLRGAGQVASAMLAHALDVKPEKTT